MSVSFTGTSSEKVKTQSDFIAFTTTYWTSTVTPGLFAGDFKVAVSSRNNVAVVVSSPIATASAFEECMAFGVGFGMDYERGDNIDLIYGLQAKDALGKTCGGIPLNLLTSTTTILNSCIQTYNLAVSTISQRWNNVYDSHGLMVAP